MLYPRLSIAIWNILFCFALLAELPAAGAQEKPRDRQPADPRPAISFIGSSTIVPEKPGRVDIPLSLEGGALQAIDARVKIAGASTAVEGQDYAMDGNTLSLKPDASGRLSIGLNILDNDAPGGRYLILEIELPEDSPLGFGKKKRHVVLIQDTDSRPPGGQAEPEARLSHLASYALPAGSSAEIIAYDPASHRLFVVNSKNNILELLDISDPAHIGSIKRVCLDVFGERINSVASHNGIVAVAMQGGRATDPGKVVFLDADGIFQGFATVGAMPDMLLFSPDGSKVLTANEGEPSDDYSVDPEGSVSIIDISGGIANPPVTTLDFKAFNSRKEELAAQGVRIFGPNATVAQDLEPESITISDDGATAYIVCQENNALAVVSLVEPAIQAILPLGLKDWAAPGLTLDASNESGGVFFANWPVKGMYQPDAVDFFRVKGRPYLITANEGDERDYEGFSEEVRIGDKKTVLDEKAFPYAEYLKEDVLLGRLRISNASGDLDGDGSYEELHAFGGRSFAIWDAATGALVYDSGSELEQITAADPAFGRIFNTQNSKNDFKSRSDDKGPEPAGVEVAEINGTLYAFIGLERVGGVVMYDISIPEAPQFIQYINTRTVDSLGGDLSPEGLICIPAEDSPTGNTCVLAACEVSGTVAIFEVATPPTIGFAGSSSVVKEGSGTFSLELAVEKAGKFSGEARVRVAALSTAKEGEDFTIGTKTVAFDSGTKLPQHIEIDILENDTPHNRYLILEIDPAGSTAHIGDTSRHILLIQDNDGDTSQR